MSNQRMSVLWLAPFVPYPPVHGGAVRIFNLIRELSRHVDISFLALSDGQPNAQSTQVLRAYCQTAEAFPRPEHTVGFHPAWLRQQCTWTTCPRCAGPYS